MMRALVIALAVNAAAIGVYWFAGVRLRLTLASWWAEGEARRNLAPKVTWTERVRRLRPLAGPLYTGAGVIVATAVELWAFVILFAIAHAVALLRPHLDRIVRVLREEPTWAPDFTDLPPAPDIPPGPRRLRALDGIPGKDPR